MKNVLEVAGFLLIVAAALTVGVGLALLVAGVGLVVAANAPRKAPVAPSEASKPL